MIIYATRDENGRALLLSLEKMKFAVEMEDKTKTEIIFGQLPLP